jgi:hypothetical protein
MYASVVVYTMGECVSLRVGRADEIIGGVNSRNNRNSQLVGAVVSSCKVTQ